MYSVGRWFLESVPQLLTLVLAVLAASAAVLAWRLRSQPAGRALRLTIADAGVLIALGCIGLLTLGRPFESQPDRVNLLPFRDQIWAFQGQVDAAIAFTTLLGNVVLFVPLGLALAARFPRSSARTIVLAGMATSVVVETIQGVIGTGRLADVTDVLANTAGAALGAWLWRRVRSGAQETAWRHSGERSSRPN